ncbi:MAG: FAD-binding protein [candidate division Zixibacteria bacterium]|nr:FAD-binding protein [candidate division Zixibacteria bacterium]
MRAEIEAALGEGAVEVVAARVAAELGDEAGARALAALCRERGWVLHPWAGGEPPSRTLPREAVLVTPGPGLTGAFALAADDYYCEVPATMRLAEVGARLRETRLWLPFATAAGPATAVGALVAEYARNAFAPAYGELHRLLFGVSFINDDGELVSTGRRTMKSVAGYDLSKLFLGSRGRAGLITRVRLRLFPRPREAVFWRARGRVPDTAELPRRLCWLEADGDVLLYADGHARDVEVVAGQLRLFWPGLTEASRGDRAPEDFAEAVGVSPRRPAAGAEAVGPGVSDLFI